VARYVEVARTDFGSENRFLKLRRILLDSKKFLISKTRRGMGRGMTMKT